MRYNTKSWSCLNIGTLIVWSCCLILSPTTGFAEIAELQDDAKPAVSKPDSAQAQLEKLRKRVNSELKTSSHLHGVWISVSKPTQVIELRTSFDSDATHAKAQKAAFDMLLRALERDKLLEKGKYKVIGSKPRPVKQLVAELNKRLAVEATLQNGLVATVYFEPQDAAGKQQFLTLIGRFGTDELTPAESQKTATRKKDTIASIVAKLIEDGGPGWRDAPGKVIVVPKPDELVAIDLWKTGVALRKRLWDSVGTESELRGIWVELNVRLDAKDLRGAKPQFELDFITDSDEATSLRQQKAVLSYVRSLETAGHLVAGRYLVSSKKSRPLQQLIKQLQGKIDGDNNLANCLVHGAYFEKQDARGKRQFLTLLGRVATNATTPKESAAEFGNKQKRINTFCDQLLAKDKDWQLPGGNSVADSKSDLLKPVNVHALLQPAHKYARQALQRSKELRGTWIDVDIRLEKDDLDGKRPTVLLNTIFDSNAEVAKEQQAAVTALADAMTKAKLVQAGRFQVVKSTSRPLAQLLETLQKHIEGDKDLENCVVCGGYFESQDQSGNRKFLVLEGRVAKPEKRAKVAKLCKQLLEANPVWSDTDAKSEPLNVVDPDILAADVRKRVNQLRDKLVDRRKRAPLNSTWIAVKVKLATEDCEGKHPQFELSLVVDAAQADQQTPVLLKALKETLSEVDYQARATQQLPISDLREQLQDRIEYDATLTGCLVLDIGFEVASESGIPSLDLIGRVANAAQRQRILDHCAELMSAQEAALKKRIWHVVRGPQDPAPTGNGLLVVAASASDASRFFSRGRDYFLRGCFQDAHNAFRMAYVNGPTRWHYLYWLVLCELELKQDERAYRRLKSITWRIRTSDLSYNVVHHTLEPIQSARRQRLTKLEDKILAELPPKSPPLPKTQ